MINFHIVTLFPEAIECYLNSSMLGRAQKNKKIKVDFYNPRDFSNNKHKSVDDKPYGGGPGMLMLAEPVLRATDKAIGRKKKVKVIFFSPSGKQFDQKMAQALSKEKHIVFLSGHYEGIDARVPEILNAEAISIGPYVLTNGILPSAVMIDAIARHIPGVLGNTNSIEERRKTNHLQQEQIDAIASPKSYTRPETLIWKRKKYSAPKVLLEGNHRKIEEWKEKQKF